MLHTALHNRACAPEAYTSSSEDQQPGQTLPLSNAGGEPISLRACGIVANLLQPSTNLHLRLTSPGHRGVAGKKQTNVGQVSVGISHCW
jgi:hypothetical protein